ncbi:MAG: class I SAM-dependent methyltransferase [Bacteroidota bacterium]
MTQTTINEGQVGKMQEYYTFHSKIYDLTRWSFLFGRKRLVKRLPFKRDDDVSIMEVGCGTGYNLVKLHKFYPKAQLVGIDVSAEMLHIAKKNTAKAKANIALIQEAYGDNTLKVNKFDAIIFSYSLSMINPAWEELINHALGNLKRGGVLAVTDFHNSRFDFFKNWMGVNHVKMEGHLLDFLSKRLPENNFKVCSAYGGIWEYFTFQGKKA